jgi:hypothetical protein
MVGTWRVAHCAAPIQRLGPMSAKTTQTPARRVPGRALRRPTCAPPPACGGVECGVMSSCRTRAPVRKNPRLLGKNVQQGEPMDSNLAPHGGAIGPAAGQLRPRWCDRRRGPQARSCGLVRPEVEHELYRIRDLPVGPPANVLRGNDSTDCNGAVVACRRRRLDSLVLPRTVRPSRSLASLRRCRHRREGAIGPSGAADARSRAENEGT